MKASLDFYYWLLFLRKVESTTSPVRASFVHLALRVIREVYLRLFIYREAPSVYSWVSALAMNPKYISVSGTKLPGYFSTSSEYSS